MNRRENMLHTDTFQEVRNGIVGISHNITTPYGKKPLIYLDWTASGRVYAPIEEKILQEFSPKVANTHTESNTTGSFMTRSYDEALRMIKKHVHASKEDVILSTGTGTTGAINKLQRLLGLRAPEQIQQKVFIPKHKRPVVFISHMEHHSNHISWSECIADVIIVPPSETGNVCPDNLRSLLETYRDRPYKIGSFSACSNVTGVITPYHELAKVMHEHDGLCFIDFAASAPYVDINMHPEDPMEALDAIFFSPHKFLGGPGTNGILIFNSSLYRNEIPDQPGGGTVLWTNPWNGRRYFPSIETREDGGTPGFLQAIRTALCIVLKEQMNTTQIHEKEKVLLQRLWEGLEEIPTIQILAPNQKNRLGILSFYSANKEISNNILVKLLDAHYGIQVRGGCSCAGTYGHHLLGIDEESKSKYYTDQLDKGKYDEKPGWVRVSLHPTTTEQEVDTLLVAVRDIVENFEEMKRDYIYDPITNEYNHITFQQEDISNFFTL